jgi:hypothetical protein
MPKASTEMAAIVIGIAIPRSRQVMAQLRIPTSLSILRPAPMRDTITTSSLRRSVVSGNISGWTAKGVSVGIVNRTAPAPTQKIGSDSGILRSTMGSQAVISMMAPRPARI